MEIVNQATYYLADGEGILVRPIRESDLPAMEWDGEYTHFRQLYADHYAASRLGTTLIYIAETLEGKMVGQVFIQLTSRNSEVADGLHRAYLFSFRVKPEYRSQGIGSFMLQFVEDQLLLRGFDSIRLNVHAPTYVPASSTNGMATALSGRTRGFGAIKIIGGMAQRA